MGIFTGAFEQRFHPGQPGEWFLNLFGLSDTAAGVTVTNQNSLETSAVFAAVRILAETSAMLPLVLYRRLERGKERARSHPLYRLLHDLPNPEMTSVELRETLTGHVNLWGNAYCEIEFNGAGQVQGLWPLRPDKTRPVRVGGRLRYLVQMPTGPEIELPANRVMHLRGLGYDGIVGYDPITLHRQAIGLASAAEEFGARFFGNGASLGTIYTHPGKLSDKAFSRLEKSLEKRHRGLSNAHRIAILEEGMDAKSVSIPPENAQFLETRKFQVSEIARIFRVPPHMLADLDRATFSNIEQQSLEFVIYTLGPWLRRWEQAIYRDLLTETERRQYFAEHLVDALLRGDLKSRYEAYAVARQNGWMSANDIRERENMNPTEGGDVYLVPLNMIPAEQVGAMNSAEPETPPEVEAEEMEEAEAEARDRFGLRPERRARQMAANRHRLAQSFRRIIEDVAGRVIRREVNDVRRAVRKFFRQRDAFQFSEWLTGFYEEHRAFWRRQILPVMLSYAEQVGISVADELGGDPDGPEEIRTFIDLFIEKLAARQVGESIGILQTTLDAAVIAGDDPAPELERVLDSWEANRAEQAALKEAVMAGNAFAISFYVLGGVQKIMWAAIGDNCPYCNDLDGRVVGIRQHFLEKGVEFEPEGAERPLKTKMNIGHPPAHSGCDCAIVAR